MDEQNPPEYSEEQKNLRRDLRAPLIVEKIPIEDGQKTFFGYAKNISRGGMFISTVKPRETGERFLIEVSLPAKPPIMLRCKCEVIWKRHFERKGEYEPGMGIRFIDLSEELADKVDEWVTTHSAPRKG